MENSNNCLPEQAIFKAFLLTTIQAAALRADLDANELRSVGAALNADWISTDGAIEWLTDINLITQVDGVLS